MKSFKLILLLSLFSYSLAGFSKTIIVTDIDDTIKMANSMGGIGGVYYFLKKRPYQYTRDLFNEIKEHENSVGEETSFYYVSAAPSFTFDAQAWLALNKFPAGLSYLKTSDNGGDTYTYKTRVIEAIIETELKADPDLKIYFFGDNSQYDMHVYVDLIKAMKLTNTSVFIRDVSTEATAFDPEVPVVKLPNVTYFFSEMELIGNKDLMFMSHELSDDITQSYKLKTLIPLYTLDTLANRLTRICEAQYTIATNFVVAKCKTEGRFNANKYWLDYYSRY